MVMMDAMPLPVGFLGGQITELTRKNALEARSLAKVVQLVEDLIRSLDLAEPLARGMAPA